MVMIPLVPSICCWLMYSLCLQGMVIGPAGQMVARIAREAGEDLSHVFRTEVRLKLSVKLRK